MQILPRFSHSSLPVKHSLISADPNQKYSHLTKVPHTQGGVAKVRPDWWRPWENGQDSKPWLFTHHPRAQWGLGPFITCLDGNCKVEIAHQYWNWSVSTILGWVQTNARNACCCSVQAYNFSTLKYRLISLGGRWSIIKQQSASTPALNHHERRPRTQQTTASHCLLVFVILFLIVILIVFIFASPHLKQCWQPGRCVGRSRRSGCWNPRKWNPKARSSCPFEHVL